MLQSRPVDYEKITVDGKMRLLLVNVGHHAALPPGRTHPMGLMALAAYIERELPRVEIDVFDMKVERAEAVDMGRIVTERGASVVGLSAMTINAERMYHVAAAVRAENPRAVILAGGPHPTCCTPKEVLANGGIDALVQGEGERPGLCIHPSEEKSLPSRLSE